MVYLKAGLHRFKHQTAINNIITILDHGPIYRLAFLRELGPEITLSTLFKSWWTNVLKQWEDTLDLIIWLDAPNEILFNRIRQRDKSHTIKDKGKQEGIEFLTHYRTFMQKTINELSEDRKTTLIRFDTSQISLEQIGNQVFDTFDVLQNNKTIMQHVSV